MSYFAAHHVKGEMNSYMSRFLLWKGLVMQQCNIPKTQVKQQRFKQLNSTLKCDQIRGQTFCLDKNIYEQKAKLAELNENTVEL